MTRAASLNSDLAECRRYYELVPAHLHEASSNRRQSFDNELWVLFAMLVELIDRIERQLAGINLENALEQGSNSATDFFRKAILPRRSSYSKLASELYEASHPGSQNFVPSEGEDRRPIEGIFWTGWQYCENCIAEGDEALASTGSVRDAEVLLFSSFFRPDEWVRNAKDIDPLMGKEIDLLLNSSVRTRLQELAHSFILGNYLAATALSRSILEYVLITKAGTLGIDPSAQNPKFPGRMKRLGVLVDEFKDAKPALAIDMEAIVEAGNATLHPKRKEAIALLRLALREKALTSIGALRRVIDLLYFPKPGAA